MGNITKPEVISFTDKLTAIWLVMVGGDPSSKLDDLMALVLATADYGVESNLADAINAMKNVASPTQIAGDKMRGILTAMDAKCKAVGLTGVSDLETYCDYYNKGTGGPYTCLLPPAFYDLFMAVKKVAPSPWNLYAAAASAIGAKTVGSGFVDGSSVDNTKYAGFARVQAVGSGITGSGLVTLTGVARDASGAVQTNRTWTVTVTGNATFDLVPTIAGDICLDATNLTIAADISAGTVTINGLIPVGRTNPPA